MHLLPLFHRRIGSVRIGSVRVNGRRVSLKLAGNARHPFRRLSTPTEEYCETSTTQWGSVQVTPTFWRCRLVPHLCGLNRPSPSSGKEPYEIISGRSMWGLQAPVSLIMLSILTVGIRVLRMCCRRFEELWMYNPQVCVSNVRIFIIDFHQLEMWDIFTLRPLHLVFVRSGHVFFDSFKESILHVRESSQVACQIVNVVFCSLNSQILQILQQPL